MDVVGFGEGSVDHVLVVSALPDVPGAKARIDERFVAYGGQVATTMAACGAMGLTTRYLGPVGADADGGALLDALTPHGVDVSQTIRREAPTRSAVILVHHTTGERVVLWSRDERLNLEPQEISPAMVRGARVVHVDATDCRSSIRLARLAVDAGSLVTTDVDAVTDETIELLRTATTPIVAEHVPREVTGDTDLETSLRRMRQPHQRLVCVTLGARGAAALDGDHFVLVPAPHVDAVDTTGAGDVFRAGVIHGLIHGVPVEQLLEFANAAAADACTRRGAISSIRPYAERQPPA